VTGADDYLIKPFSGRQLKARIAVHLQISQLRISTLKKEQQLRLEAETANKAKDQFLAMLSHELRTPLTPTLLSLEQLLGDPLIPMSLHDDIERAHANLLLEVQLIDDLLDVTKISKQKLKLHLQPAVDFHALVRQTCSLLMKEITEKNQTLSLSFVAEQHHISADPTRMHQIVWNLVKNAIKFTPEHGSIFMTSSNNSSTLSGTTTPLISLEIKDTGIGIDPTVLPKLFTPFEQGEDRARQFGGLGLGLNIAKELITMHGGTLVGKSEGRGKGATFTISLPTTAPTTITNSVMMQNKGVRFQRETAKGVVVQSPSTVSLPPSDQRNTPQLSILLVEDNKATAFAMLKVLSSGLQQKMVKHATTVKEALQMVSSNKFDLVISDLGLPDGDGLQLMRELKIKQPELVGVALTGYGTEEDVQKSLEAGFVVHLTKPIKVAQLVETLERIYSIMNLTSTDLHSSRSLSS